MNYKDCPQAITSLIGPVCCCYSVFKDRYTLNKKALLQMQRRDKQSTKLLLNCQDIFSLIFSSPCHDEITLNSLSARTAANYLIINAMSIVFLLVFISCDNMAPIKDIEKSLANTNFMFAAYRHMHFGGTLI